MKIYVASSWRNLLQPGIVHALRRLGHDVYDFRHPKAGDEGFTWKQVGAPTAFVDKVDPSIWREMLQHPRAVEGYASDISHVRDCDAVVYVLPCGRSASWEPELMFREATIITSMDELFDAFGEPAPAPELPTGIAEVG
jgi:hypothetical protein